MSRIAYLWRLLTGSEGCVSADVETRLSRLEDRVNRIEAVEAFRRVARGGK